MKFSVDQIIDEIAVLENIETKEKKTVNLIELPEEVQEGNILILKETYMIDKQEEITRRQTIEEKMAELKRLREEDTE